MLSFQDPTFFGQLPAKASTFGPNVDNLFMFVWWVCAFFFFLILGVLFYSAVKFRRKTEDQAPLTTVTHNTNLEIAWTIVPLVIVMVIFAWGFAGGKDMLVAPGDAHNIRVEAYQWGWNVSHPGQVAPSASEMWVPLNENVKVTTSSQDVLHSFFIPAFRVKRDVLPGRTQQLWFKPTRIGDYPILCTEYCGKGHSEMRGVVHVISRDEWDEAPWDVRPEDPVEWGELLYTKNCSTCHSVDGSPRVGPSFLGIWGREGVDKDGNPYKVDADYFYESVRYPQKRIVKGYENAGAMTQFAEDGVIFPEALDALQKYLQSPPLEPVEVPADDGSGDGASGDTGGGGDGK